MPDSEKSISHSRYISNQNDVRISVLLFEIHIHARQQCVSVRETVRLNGADVFNLQILFLLSRVWSNSTCAMRDSVVGLLLG